ncbi:MAG: 4Fe-4S dicluster domain-containing protein [Promethearchaeota archaeon]|jgi:heterodisulfide reductase subunit C
MRLKVKQAIFELILFLSPIITSIIYWLEEPLDSSDLVNNLIHRTGSILGIFAFIWMCFNILSSIRIKPIEKSISLEGLTGFHTHMPIIALLMMIIHYPLIRIGREYSSFQIRSGTISIMILIFLMVLALIFMSNNMIKYKVIKKIRYFASKKKIRYNFNKNLHNLMMLGVIVVFIHTLVSFTSRESLLMRIVYSFFTVITIVGWIYHKLIRRFRSESDPYIHRKATWDTTTVELINGKDNEWALSLIKDNPSLYPCVQCGDCTTTCPVSKVTNGDYNPRRNIILALSGYKNLLLEGDSLAIWGCTVCNTCDEICPQKIELTQTFSFLKNQSVLQGKSPDYINEQTSMIFENAKAIPSQPAVERRREELQLPAVAKPDLNEVQTLLRNLGIEEKLKLRR